MVLRNIYKSDINRSINGVIKVAQNDERSMEQELGEYIITKELRRHFDTFFTNYERSTPSLRTKSAYGYPAFSEAVNRTFSKCCRIFFPTGLLRGSVPLSILPINSMIR